MGAQANPFFEFETSYKLSAAILRDCIGKKKLPASKFGQNKGAP